ncbi:MAG: DNA polymerase III subunit beta [Bacteroidales bacterium]|nr:DNA polymerase III subunit beta [Bacteroidales bacterium]
MKFVVSCGELLRRLQAVGRVIASKSPMPIMDNYLFVLTGENLIITASESEMRMVTPLQVSNLEGDGKVCVPGGKLTEYLKSVPEQPVTFTINEESLQIEIATNSGRTVQVGQPADEYPEKTPLGEGEVKEFNISAKALITGINKTVFATANDDLRPVMEGVFIEVKPDSVTFVATDSHKLVRYTRTDVNAGVEASFILNKKPAQLLRNVFASEEGDVNVKYDDKNIVFTAQTYEISCRKVQGNYPQYDSVIPKNNPFHVTINRAELLGAINRVSLYADGTKLVRLDIENSAMQVSAQDLDFSYQATDSIACQLDGDPMSIGFKASYFIEVLNSMAADEIKIDLADPSRAGVITPLQKQENEDELLLIMPMKI